MNAFLFSMIFFVFLTSYFKKFSRISAFSCSAYFTNNYIFQFIYFLCRSICITLLHHQLMAKLHHAPSSILFLDEDSSCHGFGSCHEILEHNKYFHNEILKCSSPSLFHFYLFDFLLTLFADLFHLLAICFIYLSVNLSALSAFFPFHLTTLCICFVTI